MGPIINGRTQPSIHVKRREFVKSITNGASVGFSISPDSVNVPGFDISATTVTMFPWLARMAVLFEKYRFSKLSFTLIPSVATSTAGRVYMAVDPDWDDEVPTEKTQLLGYKFAADSVVWNELTLNVDCNALDSGIGFRYCSASSRGAVEPRLEYSGFLVVGFDTPTANLTFDLWVDYEVDLLVPTAEIPMDVDYEAPNALRTSVASGGTSYLPVVFSTVGPAASSLMKILSNGAAGVPLCTDANGIAADFIFTVPKVRTGAVTVDLSMAKAGSSPSTLMGAAQIAALTDVFDHAGNILGTLNRGTSQVLNTVGPIQSELIAIAGTAVHMVQNFSLKKLLSTYPTAAYLMPIIDMGVSAIAAYSTSGHVHYSA